MSIVRIAHSPTTGNAPAALLAGQIALNEADTKLFYRSPAGAVISMLLVDANGRFTVGGAAAQTLGGVTPGLQNFGLGAEANVAAARYTNDTVGSGFWMAKSRGASIGSHTILQSGDAIGTIGWLPDNGSNLTNFGAMIQGVMDGTPSATSLPGRISFNTTQANAVAVTEAARIDSSQQLRFMQTPTSSLGVTTCQIRADDQGGLSIAQASNAMICSNFGNFIIVFETTNNNMAIYIATAAIVVMIAAAGTFWVSPTSTPGTSNGSVNYDGSQNYRIYTGATVGTRTYKWFVIKIGGN